ncbi:N(5)-(carboxyethyl)ornithine synthase [Phycicoccus sp. Root101]|uniref:N(5)-(carboxyethyl)ornithine synthase n=1 Tax=Phycicoccus sp. Root101 TaxID=1736421 RepID=UPI0007037020|nr:N(5)-(carboxyethyl)ornithine synthase [Phycicoccus sp. Root101]KQU68888.1 alanine dehydrogenase [Phycicoccus sp. Root101]
MQQLSLGIVSRSRKENERRLPIHPRHLERLDPALRGQVFLEQGYGENFGISDEQLRPFVGGILSRQQLVDECDVIMLPKPLAADVAELREGQVLWGWPHCVQDAEITQLAIDKRLTLIAFEAMNHWRPDGAFNLHVLHKNNELAGYASVLHALSLVGSTGDYGRRLSAAVIGFGATARGAVTALSALGLNQVDVLSLREVAEIASPIHSANIVNFDRPEGGSGSVAYTENGPVPLATYLAEHDIIVNCVLQDPNAPMVFLHDADLPTLAPGTLVIDVSCDEGMGFSWARPTTFEDPMFTVGEHVRYYGVDHSPSYLWDSATWEISEALLPHVATVLAGSAAWDSDETIKRAVEIRDGVIGNPAILAFQSRDEEYPHVRASERP